MTPPQGGAPPPPPSLVGAVFPGLRAAWDTPSLNPTPTYWRNLSLSLSLIRQASNGHRIGFRHGHSIGFSAIIALYCKHRPAVVLPYSFL